MTAKDDNDRLIDGTLPKDPIGGTHQVVKPPPPIPRLADAITAGLKLTTAGKPTNPLLTGFAELDDGIRHFGKKEVTMLAADSGIGKSTVATQAALHAAACGYGVVYFNLEMAHEMYGLRTLANFTGTPVKRARVGELSTDEYGRMHWGMKELQIVATRIALGNPSDHRRIDTLKRFCVAAKQELDEENTPTALVVIDHVLQIQTDIKNNIDAEGKARADLLKAIAEHVDVHVLALVHVTRESSKSGSMPNKNQMASSAWFDRHADNILIFHQKRNPNGTFVADKAATLSCQKARWGEPFAIELEYKGGFFYPWSLTPKPPKRPQTPNDTTIPMSRQYVDGAFKEDT